MATVDLTNCDREPIHIPGAIQPHGWLVACTGSPLAVTQVSANVQPILDARPEDVVGTPLAEWLTEESAAAMASAHAAGFPRERNPLSVVTRRGDAFDAIAHASATPGVTIIEFEPQSNPGIGFDARMRASVRRLQDAGDRQALVEIAAAEVRALTGFDRVMVYEFDPDWHGRVVAEARREDLEPFLGLHYPASDIPAQARRLYTLNWLRIIPDIAYAPCALVPPLDPVSGAPLDMSFAVLRSVSPIHVQYLTNMGVTASMSVSLVRNGVLIGLIACHHYSGPHQVSYVTRETAEYLGQALSWHLGTLEAYDAAERELTTQRAQAILVSALATAPSIPQGLLDTALLSLTQAAGAVVVYEGQIHGIGKVPDEPLVRALVQWLADPARERVFATDRLADVLPEAEDADDTAAGVLAVDISRDLGEYVIWFRPSTERTVNWAGDPRKQKAAIAGEPDRLSPRGSFKLWRETVRGRSWPWDRWHVAAASELRTLLLGRIRKRAAELQTLNQRLSAADRAKDEFLATVSHELRTPLNAILGWILMLRRGGLPADRQQRALDTVERNARAQAKLIEDLLDVSRIMSGTLHLSVEPVKLSPIVEQALESVRLASDAKQIRLRAVLDSTASVLGDYQRLQQVMSNLLSNAVKFTPKGGRVEVMVERRDSSVELRVADTGRGISADFQPHIFERFRQADSGVARRSGGLGLGLAIVRHIVELHGGTVEVFSDGIDRGSTFTVRLPLAIAVRRELAPATMSLPADINCPPELAGVRVLIVDDEPDARELLESLFVECRATVATAASVAEALDVVGEFRPDVVISDIGMPEEDGYALIAKLRALPASAGGRTPAVALTAYARAEDRARVLLAGFQSHIAKPVEPVEILALVTSLTSMRP